MTSPAEDQTPNKNPFRRLAAWRSASFENIQIFELTIGLFWIGPRLYAALTSTSIGLTADAIQHVIDVFFMALIYFSVRAANRSHALLFPHGTGKFEAIANSALGASLIFTGFGFVVLGGLRLAEPVAPEGTTSGIVLLAIALAINLIVYLLLHRLEGRSGSIISFYRQVYLLDIIMKSVTIVFVFVSQYGGALAYLDALAALVIGASMLRVAFHALKESIWELSDRALEESVQIAILRALSAQFDAFDELLDVRTRRTGGRPIIEIFLDFDRTHSWTDVQRKCLTIKKTIEDEVTGARVCVMPTNRRLYTDAASAPS
ncbi:MAG: cation diffusion facilitator family transporter [Pseudomonadota bacterium]